MMMVHITRPQLYIKQLLHTQRFCLCNTIIVKVTVAHLLAKFFFTKLVHSTVFSVYFSVHSFSLGFIRLYRLPLFLSLLI